MQRVAASTRSSYAGSSVQFLKYLQGTRPERLTDVFKGLYPPPWTRDVKKTIKEHLLNAPESAAPLKFEDVTSDHILGEKGGKAEGCRHVSCWILLLDAAPSKI
ncbi:unnamed protein product [Phaeothamnion confervicola]